MGWSTTDRSVRDDTARAKDSRSTDRTVLPDAPCPRHTGSLTEPHARRVVRDGPQHVQDVACAARLGIEDFG